MPALSVPMRFLLAAPYFAIAAGAVLAWLGAAALQSRWVPATVAITHLMTLGFLGLAMVGALLQMVPVVADVTVPRAGLVARLAFPGLAGGALLLVAALLAAQPVLFMLAAVALGLPLAAFISSLGAALLRSPAGGSTDMVRGIRFALAGLTVTGCLGVALASFFAGGPPLDALTFADVHAAWGLLGWVLMLVVAVAFQVIPMFQATSAYPARYAALAPTVLALLLALWSACALLLPAARPFAGAAVALATGAYAVVTLRLLGQRKRPPDPTTLYWRLSMGSLLACVLLYFMPAGAGAAWKPLAIGVFFIVGFAMSAVNGMLYKIVPFLLWYHLQEAGVDRAKVPKVTEWVPEKSSRIQLHLHVAALLLLVLATGMPELLARVAGVAFALAAGKLALDLTACGLRYRRLRA